MSETGTDETGASPPSLGLVLEFAREQYHMLDVRRESLIRRAATFLGFLAVFIGLVAAAPFQGTAWQVLSAVGLVLVIVAICLFVMVTRLQTYTATPVTGGLIDGYLHRTEDETRQQVLSNTRDAIERNERKLERVERAYQWAATLTGVGTIAIGAGVVAAILAS